ncbi:MAG TPA: flagellar basal body P-ring protein FlgI, partial [Deltaproteobacteria bacterium]|nr:flagellar basal body P-ring protein FlgI [Deltaproteobacteria bacterium]
MCGRSKRLFAAGTAALLLLAAAAAAHGARIKDIAFMEGVRPNQLTGYGLVVGLTGTGDKTSARYTMQSLANLFKKMGIKIDPTLIRVKNTAAVLVTAELPPFARPGSTVDVVVSSLGDATSLEGGTLIITPLKGPDGFVYATAQGPISLGGFSAGGTGAKVRKNHQTVGKITGGAIIEKEVVVDFSEKEELLLTLRRPDFSTARNVVQSINKSLGRPVASALDAGGVRIE